MNNISEIKQLIQQNKTDLIKRYNLRSIALFGSVTRNEATNKSDVDILVDLINPLD